MPSGFTAGAAPYLDIIDFWVSRSGTIVDIPIFCCNEKLFSIDKHWQPDFSVFPHGFTENLSLHSETYINEEYGVELGSDGWPIKTDQNIQTLFLELEPLIKTNADAWFLDIVDDKSLYESFCIRCQESEFGQKAKLLLVGETDV